MEAKAPLPKAEPKKAEINNRTHQGGGGVPSNASHQTKELHPKMHFCVPKTAGMNKKIPK